ncbi:MAG: hypothetical protein R3314_12845 [Longimicrobiales bacterium]|nr:hypothetical protein [Longimicrobiales bacterium]
MMQGWVKRGLVGGALGAALVVGGASDASAQGSDRDGWRLHRWTMGLESTFDQNPFRLTGGQMDDLLDGGDRYASLSQPFDLANTLRLGMELRGRGLAGHRLELESNVRVDAYTFNRRRTSVEVDLSAAQRLSKRDEVRLELQVTPSEFRRNYLGPSGAGEVEYVAGVATTVEAELAYQRRLLRGKRGAPELDVEVGLLAGRRTYRDLPWRDRTELGAGVEADLEVGRVGFELSASGARAFDGYAGAEPVLTDLGLLMTPLDRGFDEIRVGAETSLRTGKRSRLVAEYDLRERRYTASLADDPYYGDRLDRRHSLGGELRLDLRRVELSLGAEHQFQTTFRPGQGDTGDEADYRRLRAFFGVEYRR